MSNSYDCDKICLNCKWMFAFPNYLECRKNAPKDGFSKVYTTCYCGEWEKKEDKHE